MDEIQLRGGYTTEDPRLDRLPQFDERSRNFPIMAVLAEGLPLRSFTWSCPAWLDQGKEGACVGFAWSHELAAYPVRVNVDAEFARSKIYAEAQKIDEWSGEAYHGTSVLAGAKVVQSMGYMDEYRWAFGIDDVLQTLSYHGPVVVGVNWYSSMFKPHPSGLLEAAPGGGGGHAILVRGLSLKSRLKGESPKLGPVVRLRNSWGKGWGCDGDCFIKVEDFERLLETNGDCCVPVKRARLPKPDPKAAAEVEDIETLPPAAPATSTAFTAPAKP